MAPNRVQWRALALEELKLWLMLQDMY